MYHDKLMGTKASPRRAKRVAFIDLFAGIGGIRIALERAGGKCVFSSEWDRLARVSYAANFGENPSGDITKIACDDIPEHRLLAGGFPCQAFSILGDKRGFADTRGTLFFEIERILRDKRPEALLLENVRHLVSHDHGRTFETILNSLGALGYHVQWKILNALDFGLPQKRERVIIVGFLGDREFEWPRVAKKRLSLRDVLEDDSDVGAVHYASTKVAEGIRRRLRGKPLPPEPWICHENKSGNVSPLPYSCALRAGASYNYLLVNGKRRLTGRETLRLQGFPDSYQIKVSEAAIRRQCGNSVPVPMLEAVGRQLIRTLVR